LTRRRANLVRTRTISRAGPNLVRTRTMLSPMHCE